MITGLNGVEKTLAVLAAAPFTFALTGSRAFGWENAESDWDFYTQDSPEVRLWLRANGFDLSEISEVRRHTYEGMTNTVALAYDGVFSDWEWELMAPGSPNARLIEEINRSKVHIQLVENLDLKIRADKIYSVVYVSEKRAASKGVERNRWAAVYWVARQTPSVRGA